MAKLKYSKNAAAIHTRTESRQTNTGGTTGAQRDFRRVFGVLGRHAVACSPNRFVSCLTPPLPPQRNLARTTHWPFVFGACGMRRAPAPSPLSLALVSRGLEARPSKINHPPLQHRIRTCWSPYGYERAGLVRGEQKLGEQPGEHRCAR